MSTSHPKADRLFRKIMPLAQGYLVTLAYEFVKGARVHRTPYTDGYDDYAAVANEAYRDLIVETEVALLLAEELHCTNAISLALAFLYYELKEQSSTVADLQSAFGDEIATAVVRLTPPFVHSYRYHPHNPFYETLKESAAQVRVVYGAYELYFYRAALKREYRQGYPPYLLEKLQFGVLPIVQNLPDALVAELIEIESTLRLPPSHNRYLP